MNVLIVNDDGYASQGSHFLLQDFRGRRVETLFCAPSSDQSGTGFKASIGQTVAVRQEQNGFAVDGSPVDALLAGLAIADDRHTIIDWVISGPNPGLNYGHCIHYSGTVSACREAFRLGKKAIAISLAQGLLVDRMMCESLWEFMVLLDREMPDLLSSVCLNIGLLSFDNAPLTFENEIISSAFGLRGSLVAEWEDSVRFIRVGFPEQGSSPSSGIMLGLIGESGLLSSNSTLFRESKEQLSRILTAAFIGYK